MGYCIEVKDTIESVYLLIITLCFDIFMPISYFFCLCLVGMRIMDVLQFFILFYGLPKMIIGCGRIVGIVFEVFFLQLRLS